MKAFDAKTRYALLAAMDLAEQYGTGERANIAAIAERTGAPSKYLVHILLQLKRAALVNSVRGAKGGYWLMRRPERISAADILAALEGRRGQAAPKRRGKGRRQRVIRQLWTGLQRARRQFLSGVTLAEMLQACKTGRKSTR